MKKSHKSVRLLRGSLLGAGKCFGIVVARFNEVLTERLLEGALDTLLAHGVRPKNITVVRVPGAFEIPLAAKKLVQKKKFDAVITLAVVIRGQTKHFEQVAVESARGISELSQVSEVPVILGVLAVSTISHAEARTGIKGPNKGREWALAALEMAGLMKTLKKRL